MRPCLTVRLSFPLLQYSKTILVNHVLLWEDIIEDPVDASSFDDDSRAGIRERLQMLQHLLDARRQRLTGAETSSMPTFITLMGLEALVDAQLDLLEEC
eukprot:5406975-Prymnesium_polylepis.1